MKTSLILALVLATSAAAQDFDEKPLRELSKKFVTAWNAADAAAIAALYAPDAVLTTPGGATARGRQAIQEMVAKDFKEMPGTKMSFSAEEYRPLAKDAAAWRCEWKMTGTKGAPKGTGLAVLVKAGDAWLIAEDLAALTPAGPPAPPKKDDHGHGHGAGDHGHDH